MSQPAPAARARSHLQWQAYLEDQAGQGKSRADLLDELAAAGVAPAEAQALLSGAISQNRKRINTIAGGSLLLLLCGLTVTFSTWYSAAASSSGGTVYLFVGAVVCGLTGIVYAIVKMVRARRS